MVDLPYDMIFSVEDEKYIQAYISIVQDQQISA